MGASTKTATPGAADCSASAMWPDATTSSTDTSRASVMTGGVWIESITSLRIEATLEEGRGIVAPSTDRWILSLSKRLALIPLVAQLTSPEGGVNGSLKN
ncbi:hypothetical protein Taro_001217 [Colocasia esculenta]|uniref:Uncharacterized protein n=1 Tax=Colocasia esculenta TaxID=4460 RepID=A0A843TFH4_COLES|nr:hypothetical protein [Colocasia esculenta]